MITLDRAKEHLRIDCDCEDVYIFHLIKAAKAWVENYLGDRYPEINNPNIVLVETAELMLVAELYENREISVPSDMHRSKTFFMLLEPLREKSVS